MLNVSEIQEEINKLENGATTHEAVKKLVALYAYLDRHAENAQNATRTRPETVIDIYTEDMRSAQNSGNSDAVSEYKDILPTLAMYMQAKADQRAGKKTQEHVNHSAAVMVQEVKEFLLSVWAGTTAESEREILRDICK